MDLSLSPGDGKVVRSTSVATTPMLKIDFTVANPKIALCAYVHERRRLCRAHIRSAASSMPVFLLFLTVTYGRTVTEQRRNEIQAYLDHAVTKPFLHKPSGSNLQWQKSAQKFTYFLECNHDIESVESCTYEHVDKLMANRAQCQGAVVAFALGVLG